MSGGLGLGLGDGGWGWGGGDVSTQLYCLFPINQTVAHLHWTVLIGPVSTSWVARGCQNYGRFFSSKIRTWKEEIWLNLNLRPVYQC